MLLQVPQTVSGKVMALMGIAILGMFTAMLTTKLQVLVAQLAENDAQQVADVGSRSVANARVGVLNGSIEKHLVLQEGGNPVSGASALCSASPQVALRYAAHAVLSCSQHSATFSSCSARCTTGALWTASRSTTTSTCTTGECLFSALLRPATTSSSSRLYVCATRTEHLLLCSARLATRIPAGSVATSCNGRRAAQSPSAQCSRARRSSSRPR